MIFEIDTPPPAPAPAPKPAPPAPAAAPVWPQVLQALVVVFMAGIVAWDHGNHPTPAPGPAPTPSPAPAPAPPPAAVAPIRGYLAGFPAEVKAMADAVAAGRVKTAADLAAHLAGYTKPTADALKALTAARCDAEGNVNDPAALADDLARTATALGAK